MQRFGNGYQIDEGYSTDIKPGEYESKIIKAKESTTKTGNPMIEIRLQLQNSGFINYFLVDDRSTKEKAMFTNQRITKFFDCFRIQRGDFNINHWVGAKGRVKVGFGKPTPTGVVYSEVKNLLIPPKQSPYQKETFVTQPKNTATQVQGAQSMQTRCPPLTSQPTQRTQTQKMASKSDDEAFDNFPEEYMQHNNYQDEYIPTNEELMQEAREEGYDVSEEYIYNMEAPTGEAYDEDEIY